jgi:hypothetical protein
MLMVRGPVCFSTTTNKWNQVLCCIELAAARYESLGPVYHAAVNWKVYMLRWSRTFPRLLIWLHLEAYTKQKKSAVILNNSRSRYFEVGLDFSYRDSYTVVSQVLYLCVALCTSEAYSEVQLIWLFEYFHSLGAWPYWTWKSVNKIKFTKIFNLFGNFIYLPVTVAAPSKPWTVFARSDARRSR